MSWKPKGQRKSKVGRLAAHGSCVLSKPDVTDNPTNRRERRALASIRRKEGHPAQEVKS